MLLLTSRLSCFCRCGCRCRRLRILPPTHAAALKPICLQATSPTSAAVAIAADAAESCHLIHLAAAYNSHPHSQHFHKAVLPWRRVLHHRNKKFPSHSQLTTHSNEFDHAFRTRTRTRKRKLRAHANTTHKLRSLALAKVQILHTFFTNFTGCNGLRVLGWGSVKACGERARTHTLRTRTQITRTHTFTRTRTRPTCNRNIAKLC